MRFNAKHLFFLLGAAVVAYIAVFVPLPKHQTSERVASESVASSASLPVAKDGSLQVAQPIRAEATLKNVATPNPATPREASTGALAFDIEEPTPLDTESLALRAQERLMLDARWSSQSTDPRWSDEVRSRISDLLSQAQLDPSAASLPDCRATICRVVFSAGNGRDALRVIDIARKLHDETWIDHHDFSDQAWEIELFVSRKGFRLSGDGSRIEGET